MGGATALVVGLGIAGSLGGDDAAVADVVAQSQATSARIGAASDELTGTIAEARALAEQTSDEVADPTQYEGLLQAIEAAEAVAVTEAAQATSDMSLEEAKSAQAGAAALLASLEAAGAPLRAAMDAASQSHAAFVAAALTEAKAAYADAQASLAAAMSTAEQALADSAGRVDDDGVRVRLQSAIDAARTTAATVPAEDDHSFRDATSAIVEASQDVEAERAAVGGAVAAKAETDRLAAEQAAAAASQRAAEEAAANEPADEGADGGSAYYENCDAVRAAGAAPIRVGDPGYSTKLDRDHDGVGCEN